MSYIPLHVQSHYSILQAVPTVDELVHSAQNFNLPALALTDLNNMFGVPEFGKAMKKAGLKPIFGAKINLQESSRFSVRTTKEQARRPGNTLVLLARTDRGYRNLLKLMSSGYRDASFGRFHIDRSLLEEYAEGLLALSSDNTGLIRRLIREKNEEAVRDWLSFFTEVFGKERFFIELQDHGTPEDKITNKSLLSQAGHYGLKYLASNTVRFLKPEDQILCDVVTAIDAGEVLPQFSRSRGQGSGDLLIEGHKKSSLREPLGTEYFKSPEEMAQAFRELPEALSNTFAAAEMCEDIAFQAKGDQSPQYPIPQGYDTPGYLRLKANEALRAKFPEGVPSEYQKRLDWELDTVCSMGFPNYFLVVGDFVGFARKNGIFVGPGRGSAAGALLSYVLGITNIDPLPHDLLFERFLNPERISMPDIDIDFEDERRDEVKEYLRTAYGTDKTADVVTFGYNKAKAVLRDVGRVLDIPISEVNQICGAAGRADVDEKLKGRRSSDPFASELALICEEVAPLKSLAEGSDPVRRKWMEYSSRLCDRIRNLGKHASAIIVAGPPLDNIVPLARDKGGAITTQFEGGYLEENGLLKMDILGLANLGIIRDCLERIQRERGELLFVDNIPLDDTEVYNMFSEGYTAGVFQFESEGMTGFIKQLKPTGIEDLIAMNALYRPGPMDNIPSYIDRKHGKEPVDCFHPDLDPILKPTYGVIVYQEQVMQIAQVLCGFSLGEADNVRRIMAKKKPEELEKIYTPWIEGATQKGYPPELAEKLFELLIPFSNYAFNKSHAACYSVLAYQTAWLKTHYTPEYMAALMAFNINKDEQLGKYIYEARALGIPVLAPDINKSGTLFELEKDAENKTCIRYGFNALKGMGGGISEEIVQERRWGGPYAGVEDFVERTYSRGVRKGALALLIKAGAFNSFFTEDALLNEKAVYLDEGNLNTIYKKYEKAPAQDEGFALFSTDEIAAAGSDKLNTNITPFTEEKEYSEELEVFGFSFAGRRFDKIFEKYGKYTSFKKSLGEVLPSGTMFAVMGHVSEIYMSEDARKRWGRFSLNTGEEEISISLFGDQLERFSNSGIQTKSFVYVKAVINEYTRKDGAAGRSFKAVDFIPLAERKPALSELHILVDKTDIAPELSGIFEKLREMAKRDYLNKAHIGIRFHLAEPGGFRHIQASPELKVFFNPDITELLNTEHIHSFWFA